MKKHLLIALGLVLAIAVGAAIGVPWLIHNQAAADTVDAPAGAAPLAAAATTTPRAIVAEARVVPAQHATLSLAAGGIVAGVLAREGDTVEAGQLLVRLSNAQQQAAVAQAQAALASAQARLDSLRAGPRAEEIEAAQAGLEASQARLARLTEGAPAADIAAARANLDAAQASLRRLYDGPDKNTRIAAEADLSNAEAALQAAQAAYDPVAGEPNVAMLPQSLQLQQATNNYQAAKARYDALFAAPESDRVAQVRAQVKQAEANLEHLLKPATAGEIAEAGALVRQTQAQLDLLRAGASAGEIAAAVAGVDEARSALDQAQAALADTELRAPFAGTLAALNAKPGEPSSAGTPLVELGDLTTWQIETEDLTELDIARVREGQAVTLTFDAIPGLTLPGTVVRIQPLGREKLGDITYTVVVRLDADDPRLRWNMTAVVTIP